MTIFIIAFLSMLVVIQLLSIKYALKDVEYDYGFSKKLIETSESTELISTVTNKSRRFISYIRMVEALPVGIRPINNKVAVYEDTMGMGYLRYDSSIYLLSRSKLKRKLEITFDERGRYLFKGATLHGGDFLGFMQKREEFQEFRELVVYPKKIESAQLDNIIGGFLGDISVRRFIMEDPILTIGTRDYTGREPLKQISWKHTARTNKMMVKQFDYTTEMNITVLLDISAVSGKTITKDQFEACFCLARTVCEMFEQKKAPYQFISNAILEGVETVKNYQLSNTGGKHFSLILERLGRSAYGTSMTYELLIEEVMKEQKDNHSIIIITPIEDRKKKAIARTLEVKTRGVMQMIYGQDYVTGDAI